MLGQGSFGKVLKAEAIHEGNIVAVKVMDKTRIDATEFEQIMVEVDILRAIYSPYVVKYLDFFESHREIYIVQEYLNGTNMVQYLREGAKPEPEGRKMFKQLAVGL
jgi:serine/threonine protein kinase